MLSWVEHEKNVFNLGAWIILQKNVLEQIQSTQHYLTLKITVVLD